MYNEQKKHWFKTNLCYNSKVKSLLFLLFFFISLPSWSAPKNFMVCLGKEEAFFHKNKTGGAFYKLNQEVISILVQMSDQILMNKNIENAICNETYVSLEILNKLLTEKDIFYSTNTNQSRLSTDLGFIKELKIKSIQLFIDFTNNLQAQMPDAQCLYKEIPKLKTFHERLRYTMEDVDLETILKILEPLEKIFEQLKTIPKKMKSC